jgi:hypothetical protein
MRRIPVLVFLLGLAAAVATGDTEPTLSSRPVRLLRTYYDSIKTSQGDVPRRVDILYDYDLASAFERTYTLDGAPLSNRRIVVNPPTPSDAEVAEAYAIVRGDREMSKMIRRFRAELEGGFIIEEGRLKPCGPRSRCLLIQVLSPDHSGLIRVTAVDLVKRQIIYRTFVPSEHPGVK